MGAPAAKKGDRVTATDMHMIQAPGTAPPVLMQHPFTGILDGALSADVNIMGLPAGTVGSTASNTPPHLPNGGSFVNPPTNKAKIILGSFTVFINGKAAARASDTATTCNDPSDLPAGKVVASGTVLIG
jgi:uncharacterized Zn-binding protein involved in type VI secretion